MAKTMHRVSRNPRTMLAVVFGGLMLGTRTKAVRASADPWLPVKSALIAWRRTWGSALVRDAPSRIAIVVGDAGSRARPWTANRWISAGSAGFARSW